MSEQVAVFGGSFDPPHVGHTLVAGYVLAAHPVDRVLVVPCEHHPFDKQLAPFADRLAMCRLAMADLRRVEVSDIAGEVGGSGRTLELLEALRERQPAVQLRLVIGSDLLGETARWYRFDRIEQLAPPLIVQRGGHAREDDEPVLPEVSSTDIRGCFSQGRSVAGRVTPAVAAYATEHGLYR